MKKIILSAIAAGFLSLTVNAQNQIDKLLLDQKKKDKQKSDEAIADPKKNTKAQTWMDRGVLYNELATMYMDIDSSASTTAVEAFKKVLVLDNKDGKQGASAKKAAGYLAGGKEDNVDLYRGLFNGGVMRFQAKNYMGAKKFFDLAQEITPKDTTAPLYSAYSALQAKDNNLAKPQLEKYIANGGTDAGNFGMLSSIYRLEKDWDKAIAVVEKGIKAVPKSALDLKAEKVNILIDAKRMSEAKVGLKELADLDPKNAQYPTNYAILNDNEASGFNDEIKKLAGVGKGVAKAQKKLDDEKGKLDVYVSEQKRISDLMKKQPKNVDLKRQLTDVQKLLAEAKTKVDEETKAVAAAQEATKSAGDVTAKIADLTQKMNTTRSEATNYYNKALSIDPKNYDALFNLGVYYFNDAVEIKKQVDEMDMKEYNEKGKAVESRVCGRFKQSIPYFQKAKALRSDEEQVSESLKMAENLVKEFEAKKIPCEETK